MGKSRIEKIIRSTTAGVPYTEPAGSDIEEALIELNELIIGGGGGGGSTEYATALSLTINSSTYVMTAQLLNKDGDPLGTAQTVDLPLESVVVGATYDSTTKSIILTLQSGSTTSVPVGDLVAGLVSTSDLETALTTKQDTISDLATIRSNATSGAGAAEVVQGIDSTANNYIEMKSGQREYLSAAVPTGNIPTGSVGTGFDEGVYTYKSGTKVSEGVEITDSSDPHYQQKKFPFYANSLNLADYTIYGNTGGVGDEIVNYFDKSVEPVYATTELYRLGISGFDTTKTYTCSTNYEHVEGVSLASIAFNNDKSSISSSRDGVWAGETQSRTPDSDGNLYVYIRYVANGGAEAVYDDVVSGTIWVMINEGTTSEPYNKYKLPIICGNTTTNIYIDSPLDDGDSIDYATSQVAIPTVDGANNLICDTTVQPSKVSLTYTGWHSDLEDATARIEALENAPAPSGGMTYDTLYEGTTASSYPYQLAHAITDYKFIIVAVGYSNVYTNTVIPVAVWSTVTSGGGNYDITVDTAQLRVNASEIVPRSANNRIVYGVYGIK